MSVREGEYSSPAIFEKAGGFGFGSGSCHPRAYGSPGGPNFGWLVPPHPRVDLMRRGFHSTRWEGALLLAGDGGYLYSLIP
ncbi:MAG: hypothetical protein K1Y36_28795 [Blastocatellia bacterium]|nr:hypothetical protein [Blastocatellia bacterium]